MSQINTKFLFAPGIQKNINQNKWINKKILKEPLHGSRKNSPEMPFYASRQNASYTIEAAIIMPLFITLMVFGIFMFRILQVQSTVQHSIDMASRTMAVTLGNTARDEDSMGMDDAALFAATIGLAEEQILTNDVPLSYVDGGILGFNYLESNTSGKYIDLRVSYTMTFPVGLFGDYKFNVSQRAKNRKWVGYDPAENEWDGKYVYVTTHGSVYHTDTNCTYLYPSVRRISEDEVSSARNESGGKYYLCKRCGATKSNGYVYITDYGTAYHTDITCTEIRHDVNKVLYDSVKDVMDGCSKCAGE